MKSVSQKAASIFRAAITRIPEGQTSVKIDKGDQEHGGLVMALHVQLIGENKYGKIYSFAHYYEQNGDLMRDPDITMLEAATGQGLFPLSYRQDGLGMDREYVVFTETGWKIFKKMQADLVSFCNGWAKNLHEQQDLWPVKVIR